MRETMYQATLAEAARRYGSREPAFNYRWEHVQAVATVARRLAELTGADLDVVEAAAWLHDSRKDMKDTHGEAGAEFARAFLTGTDFPAGKIEPVAEAIATHVGLWREEPLENLEAQVLWDADKLAKLGLTAAFHFLAMRLANGGGETTMHFVQDGREQREWQEKTVASIHTAPARGAAEARLRRFQRLWDELELELGGGDLNAL